MLAFSVSGRPGVYRYEVAPHGMRKRGPLSLECSRSLHLVTVAALITPKEVLLSKANRKTNSVRMLDQAVRLLERAANSRMSGKATGRLVIDLREQIAILKHLEQDDPDGQFWKVLERAIAKFVRCLRQMNR